MAKVITMRKEIRTPIEYPPTGSKDTSWISGWLSVRIMNDNSIDVYAEPDQALVYARSSTPTEAEKIIAQGTELIFRVLCKNGDEAEKTARSIVNFMTKPGIICLDMEDCMSIAAAGDHEAKLWLFESFDDEPMEEFKKRIKTALPPLTSLNYMLQVEGDISLMDVYDLANMITDLSSEDANIAFQAQYHEETPGYKAFFVFSFEGENISQVQTEG